MTGPARTWDGLSIAADKPTGCTVVVRRPGRVGALELLVLHRAHQGPDDAGDWAWTAPAGCRQPGEPVYAAVLRELAEESGLTGLAPWMVDATRPGGDGEPGRWALFAVDVPAGTEATLVDPEHDRHEWLGVGAAVARMRPELVAAAVAKGAAVPAVGLGFRPMREDDLGLMTGWMQQPHVMRWWDARSRDEDSVRARYLPRLGGDHPVRMWVVEVDGIPAGFLQSYLVGHDDDYTVKTGDPGAAAFDYAIGEPELVDHGLGTRMVWEFCRDVLRAEYPAAVHFLASPSHRNARSLRTLAKCGFAEGRWIDSDAGPGEPPDTEIVCTLDVRHWLG